jgi:hypothetical protein
MDRANVSDRARAVLGHGTRLLSQGHHKVFLYIAILLFIGAFTLHLLSSFVVSFNSVRLPEDFDEIQGQKVYIAGTALDGAAVAAALAGTAMFIVHTVQFINHHLDKTSN